MPDKEWYTAEEAMSYLGVSRATLERMVVRGQLQKYSRGGDQRVYFKKSEMDETRKFRPRDKEKG